MHIVHVAAENDNLPGAKVGGIGDVVRDIAPALADLDHQVTVLTPSQGFLHLAYCVERAVQALAHCFLGFQHLAGDRGQAFLHLIP